eukprot:g32994.t1
MEGASQQREAGIEEAVRKKRRLLEAMYFMAETCNNRLMQMSRIALGDPLHPGRALRLCPLDCSMLAVSLAPMGIIEELNLGHCWIGPEGLQRFSTILPQCRSLRSPLILLNSIKYGPRIFKHSSYDKPSIPQGSF